MTDSVNIRALALDSLIEINERGGFSHRVTGSVLDKYQYLQKQQRAFYTRLVEGTLERQIGLDYAIDAFSAVPVRRQKPLIRNLLRMSFYQLYEMDQVPASAVCNEAVKLAKKRGFARLSGFVNGVLRTAARSDDPRRRVSREEDPLMYLTINYAVPEWIASLWLTDYGLSKTESILSAFFADHPLTIRSNPYKCTPGQLAERLKREGVARVESLSLCAIREEQMSEPRIWEAGADAVTERTGPQEAEQNGIGVFAIGGFDSLGALGAFRDGWFYVQDIGSMMVAYTAGAKPGDHVIDVCAAPGGKSTHIAQLIGDSGMVEARDLTAEKTAMIEQNRKRQGIQNLRTAVRDATVYDPADEETADILICDLPCSGLGVMGRKPDIRYKAAPEKTKELVRLQRSILRAVHTYVKRGGVLCYSTCTINRAENEDNVAWFLREYPEYTLLSQKQLLPDEGPWDGFFLAKLQRL